MGKAFETPANKGNNLWGDVSDISICLPDVEPAPAVVEDDYDEIEYMAPNTLGEKTGLRLFAAHILSLDMPYQPPFDFELPDYKVVGKTLVELSYSQPYYDEDTPPEDLEIDIDGMGMTSWNMLHVPNVGTSLFFHFEFMSNTRISRRRSICGGCSSG